MEAMPRGGACRSDHCNPPRGDSSATKPGGVPVFQVRSKKFVSENTTGGTAQHESLTGSLSHCNPHRGDSSETRPGGVPDLQVRSKHFVLEHPFGGKAQYRSRTDSFGRCKPLFGGPSETSTGAGMPLLQVHFTNFDEKNGTDSSGGGAQQKAKPGSLAGVAGRRRVSERDCSGSFDLTSGMNQAASHDDGLLSPWSATTASKGKEALAIGESAHPCRSPGVRYGPGPEGPNRVSEHLEATSIHRMDPPLGSHDDEHPDPRVASGAPGAQVGAREISEEPPAGPLDDTHGAGMRGTNSMHATTPAAGLTEI
jgi:hypothetical protein